MIYGVSLSSSLPESGPQLMIERAGVAFDAGFASLTVGDNHNLPVPYAQNTPILGRLLAEWPGRPAGCLFLVPLWHPVIMAEQIGTLAATHDGPFIVQTGIGHGKEQFAALGADLGTRGRVLEETIEAVKAMLAGEVVDNEYLGLVGGRVGLRPPGPVEWWIGAGVDVAIRRAVNLGDAWYAAHLAPDDAARPIEYYRSLGGKRAILRKDALVLADGDEARRRATELVERGYRGMGLDQLLVGNPDDVAEQVAWFEAMGYDEIIVRCVAVPQELALETLASFQPLIDA